MLIGIETGGTKIVCSAGTSPQDVVDVATVPTQDPTSTLQSVTAFVTRWQQEAGLEGVGIGPFGPVDLDPRSRTYGHLLQTPKLAWRGVDVVGPVAQAKLARDLDLALALAQRRQRRAPQRERHRLADLARV